MCCTATACFTSVPRYDGSCDTSAKTEDFILKTMCSFLLAKYLGLLKTSFLKPPCSLSTLQLWPPNWIHFIWQTQSSAFWPKQQDHFEDLLIVTQKKTWTISSVCADMITKWRLSRWQEALVAHQRNNTPIWLKNEDKRQDKQVDVTKYFSFCSQVLPRHCFLLPLTATESADTSRYLKRFFALSLLVKSIRQSSLATVFHPMCAQCTSHTKYMRTNINTPNLNSKAQFAS